MPGEFQKVLPETSGCRIKFTHAEVDVQFLSPTIIRVSWEPGNPPLPYTIEKQDWAIQQLTIHQNESACLVSSDQVSVVISNHGSIEFLDRNGITLRYDQPPCRNSESWQLTSQLNPEEHIFGLGERIISLNLRPGIYSCWNRDVGGSYSPGTDPLYIGTPLYLSLSAAGSYLVYFENSYYSRFVFNDQAMISFEGGMLRYYFIYGSMSSIYKELSELLGKPFMPPRWVLGYHQCRWGYRNEEDIRNLVKGFRNHELPISAIHLDIDYMDGYRVFSIHPQRFPNLKNLSEELDEVGIKVVVTVNPAVKKDDHFEVYVDGLNRGFFCKLPDGEPFVGISWPGLAVYPDLLNEETRGWWAGHYKTLIDAGASGFWHDMNEPVSFTAWGDMSFPSNVVHVDHSQSIKHKEVHNLYGFLMNKSLYEGLRKQLPDKRPWIFSRAGWAGMQRYAWNWTGDIESTWEALAQTIPSILGLSLSGHIFAGVDIGGFSGNPEAELYLRWFQLATFLPLFRTHSAIGTKPREPWVYGEPITSIIRTFLQLRYKLMPYLYTITWDACQTGEPAIRPIFWDIPNDTHLWDIEDEFLLGDTLLIAPVVEKGAQSRRVMLPSGSWYSFWDDRMINGPCQFDCEVSQEDIPIFVKGGSLLPLDEDGSLSLHIYPLDCGDTSSHVYIDQGDGYGVSRVDTFRFTIYAKSMQIFWESRGEFPFPYARVKVVVHGIKIRQAIADQKIVSTIDQAFFTPMFRTLQLIFE